MRVVGLISGTSYDAIDVAVADLSFADDGATIELARVGERSVAFDPQLRAEVAAMLPPATTTAQAVCELDTRLGQAFADAARRTIDEVAGGHADLVVSHGQTIFHWVEGARAFGTLQLGQPAWIAAATGLPVVADLRAADIAAGGQGAPLASTLDVLLLGADAPRPRAALNLGGIANVTIVGGGREPIAFDTGPANALLDAAVSELTGGAATYDHDGALAAAGTVDEALLASLRRDPYFALPPPKSTGKEHFHLGHLRGHLGDRPVDVDVLATLVELTATTVTDACRASGVVEVVASGGGVANPTLLAALRRCLGDEVGVRTIDKLGLPAGDKEAYLFALLGFLTVHGLPGVVASATGAQWASILGAILPGSDGLPQVFAPAVQPQRLKIA